MPADEPVEYLQKVSWNTDENKYRLLYAAAAEGLIKHMGVQAPNGVTTFDDKQLDKAADWLASQLPSTVFALDFEPGNPDRDGWWWNFSDPRSRKTLYALSERIYKKHKNIFTHGSATERASTTKVNAMSWMDTRMTTGAT